MDRNHKDRQSVADAPRLPVRMTALDLYESLLLDAWPGVPTTVDFGISTQAHYEALQYAVLNHDVSPEQLDDAMGSGPALTALIRPDNPYFGVTFETPWDGIMESIKAWADVGPGGKFPLGRLFATPAALGAVPREEIVRALRRHAEGDWGDVSGHERAENDHAVLVGGRLSSAYRSRDGRDFEVSTEPDRSITLVNLAGEV